MCKWQRVIPRHKGSPRYRIAHGWKDEYGSKILKLLIFLMHFREPESSLYFIFINSYFSFLIHIFLISSFLYTHHFYVLPLNSKLNCDRRLLVLGQRGDMIEIR
jgi:hypothetical protein